MSASPARRQRAARGSGDQLRAEILQAARNLLAETGSAEEVSIRAVSEIVGVSAPSIYRHFADKDALIDAVVAEVFAEFDDVMQTAAADAADPIDRLRLQGMAYVRFAREHPEQYRLATTQGAGGAATVDRVLGTAVFANFLSSVTECVRIGFYAADADPTEIAMELWAAAHGIVSLQIAKPNLPWGDPDAAAERVLKAACIGRAVSDLLDDPTPQDFSGWMRTQRQNHADRAD